jgi:hypothetical protein
LIYPGVHYIYLIHLDILYSLLCFSYAGQMA